MGVFAKHPPARPHDEPPLSDDAVRALVEAHQQTIDELVAALIAGEAGVDLKLAEVMENLPERARIAIIEKMQAMLAEQDEAKARELEQFIQQQKEKLKEQKQQVMQQWLAFFMSQETLRKMRESFLAFPHLERQVRHIGQELAKTGVLQNIQLGRKQDLGDLTAQVQHQQQQTGRSQGPQR